MGTKRQGVSKLFGLKSWLELDEAARHVGEILDEEVRPADLLRFGLEGHLTLSVRFASAVTVVMGKALPYEQVERREFPALDGDGVCVSLKGTAIPNSDHLIVFEEELRNICDVWDLPMIGGERLSVENEYELYRQRSITDLFNLEGTFVCGPDDCYCKLMEFFEGDRGKRHPLNSPLNCYPAALLPEDSTIVIRRSSLDDLLYKILYPVGAENKQAVGRRERTTLLTIIAALAKMAKVDVGKPSSAAAAIESETARMGTRVAARTIENHLKLIPEAVDARHD